METTNYEQFKTLEGNRQLSEGNVKNLIKSIQTNGYVGSPILVNKNFEILDGQHRLEALKELKLPVPYEFRDFDLSVIQQINSASKKWTMMDYIRSYSDRGFTEYTKLLKYIEQTKSSGTAISAILSRHYTAMDPTKEGHGEGKHKIIQSGNFQCYNESVIEFYFSNIGKLSTITENYQNGKFLIALAWCYRHVNVPTKDLLDRMIQFRHLFEKGFPSASLWVKAMSDCWNYNRSKKIDFFNKEIDRCEIENKMKDSQN